ncbi:hypothetical protein J2T57_002226 [Natronocella acetinitrilica]|uniref:Phasin domain-containing protein n=1 Tax=Natronocella acetinitrilica TaxID=414046 RepID=A0AAE3KCK4_9GAMM|nr:hypothetical protein [Natronocella acetinitrilica]MCP1675078.1 hypothetical protein [Natronocella acetinitrilica]
MMHVFLAQVEHALTAMSRSQINLSRMYMEHVTRVGSLQLEAFRHCFQMGVDQVQGMQAFTLQADFSTRPALLPVFATASHVAQPSGDMGNIIDFADAARRAESRLG